ncbi:hypothetical protein EV183_002421 [Coemansia sp. RSA 2336]|nr:hypothetical protein EV183_002421 [Coemansia sp. RSA 2336]
MGEQAETTYHDKEQQILGCQHYQVKAKVLAQCCSVWVPCRFCHNDMQDHSMDRFAVERMKCMLCLEEQPLGQQCQKCKATVARYFCKKCRLLDDGPDKKVFHCDQCGICRSGSPDEFFHCKGCDACVATEYRDSHGCREHILHADCPICGEDLRDSTQTVVQIACEHLIHEACLQQSLKYSYKCPLCSASLCNMDALFGAIERYLQLSSMPHKYRNRTSRIFCNDCRQRSAAKFHFMYHKRRDELLTTAVWVNDLKSRYLEYLRDNARELPTDLEHFPSSIHEHIDFSSSAYARNREALVAYRAREILAERMQGAAFIPSSNELKKLEASVEEEERLLQQVQQRLSEKVGQASANIDEQSLKYQQAQQAAQTNEELARSVTELEAELEALLAQVEEKEQRERDAIEQQTRELQAAHNEVVRETAQRDSARREQQRLAEREQRLRGDEQQRQMSTADSHDQQRLTEQWIRAVAPAVAARVEGNTLIVTLGDGIGALSNRRILARFNELGRIEHVRTDDGRTLPPQLNHDMLMRLLSEQP